MAIQQFDFATGKVYTTDRRHAMLLVKDTATQEQLLTILRENLYKVPIKSAGVKEVLKAVPTQKTGILFLDHDIEGVNVMDLITSIRNKFPEIVIILISASPTKELAETMLKVGVRHLIEKPIDRDQVYHALAKIK